MDLFGDLAPLQFVNVEEAARALEACETPEWAANVGLTCSDLLPRLIDPCVGRGHLARPAIAAGFDVRCADIYPWEYDGPRKLVDFLAEASACLVDGWEPGTFDVFMNPPFSKATQFVDRAFEIGARKVMSFQRLAWLESSARRAWWNEARCKCVYVCGERATWWWFHIPPEDRKGRSQSQAHAWFEFDRDHSGDPVIRRLYKDGVA